MSRMRPLGLAVALAFAAAVTFAAPAAAEEDSVAAAARRGRQRRFEVHAFPFRNDQHPAHNCDMHPWAGFWKELQPAFDAFNATGKPPTIRVVGGKYQVEPR
jgi:murein L,D-transpeptidase YafK